MFQNYWSQIDFLRTPIYSLSLISTKKHPATASFFEDLDDVPLRHLYNSVLVDFCRFASLQIDEIVRRIPVVESSGADFDIQMLPEPACQAGAKHSLLLEKAIEKEES